MSTEEEREAIRVAKAERRKALFEAGGKFLERVAGLAMKINAGELDVVSAVAQLAAPAISHIFKVGPSERCAFAALISFSSSLSLFDCTALIRFFSRQGCFCKITNSEGSKRV